MASRRGVQFVAGHPGIAALAVALATAIAVLALGPAQRAGADSACDRVASPTGSDLAAGTALQPFRSPARLVQSLAPGQTGCLRGGSYAGALSIAKGGAPGTPITLQSYAGEQAEIVGRVVIDAPHVELRRLRLVGTPTIGGSLLVRAGFVLLKDNEITNRHTADCVKIGLATRRVSSVAVRGNRIHDCGVLPSTNRHNGLNIVNASGTEVVNNWIYDNADRGVQLFPNADDSRLALNVIDGNGEGIMFAGAGDATSDRNVIEGNIITNSVIRDNVESSWAAGGPVGQDNVVSGNCVSGGVRDDGDGGIADVRDGFVADANLIEDPQYVNRATKDFRLRLRSPCQAVFGREPAVTCNKVASTAGSDGGAGTTTSPYGSVERLVESLGPGQTGCLRAGTYDENVRIGNGGRAGAPITLTSYPRERATIRGRLVVSDSANFVTVSRLNLNGTNAQILPSPTVNGDDVTFTRNDITNDHTTICFVLGSDQFGRALRTTIQANRIHDCGVLPADNHHHGIYVEAADDAAIVDNWIYDNADRGVQLFPDSQRAYVARNVIDSNGQGVIFSRESAGNVVEHNVISNSLLRWNIEEWELTGLGNLARRNCVWTTRDDGYGRNGGVQPADEFGAIKNVIAAPGFVDAAGKDFRVAPDSPCLDVYTSPFVIPGS